MATVIALPYGQQEKPTLKLRLYRTFEWVMDVPLSQAQIGGKNPYALKATDTLQQFDEATGTWANVEVVEAEKPPHPHDARQPTSVDIDEGFTGMFKDFFKSDASNKGA
jgi:hypothetical protein